MDRALEEYVCLLEEDTDTLESQRSQRRQLCINIEDDQVSREVRAESLKRMYASNSTLPLESEKPKTPTVYAY